MGDDNDDGDVDDDDGDEMWTRGAAALMAIAAIIGCGSPSTIVGSDERAADSIRCRCIDATF
jgi:hypothetical protein